MAGRAETTLRAMFAAFNARDDERFVAAYDPAIVFVPLFTVADPGREPYRGHAGMRRYLQDVRSWADGQIHVTAVQDFDELAIAQATIVITPHGAEPRSVDVTYVVHARGDRICELTTLADAQTARTALGLPGDRTNAFDLTLPAIEPSVAVARRTATSFAHAGGCPDTSDIALAVTEAATNVVLHAYFEDPEPGALVLHGDRAPRSLTISVQDAGRGLRPRLDSPGIGMGLSLMQHAAAEITFVGPPQRPAGTEVRLRFTW